LNILLGKVPLKWLLPKSKNCKFFRLPNSWGIEPERELSVR
jgi:hypothetical protein